MITRSPVRSPTRSAMHGPLDDLFGIPSPVALAAAVDDTSGGIELTWDAVSTADSYNIYYAVDGGAWQSASTGETGTSYTFTPSEAGSYSFGVTTVSGSSESGKAELTPSGLFDDVPDDEGIALMAFYDSTDGDNWTDNTNWMMDSTVGNWYGVTVSGGHVTEIDFGAGGDENVSGEFALSDLPSSMEYLNLGNTSNTITGTLSDLPSSMEYLRLYNTSSTITGTLSDLPSSMEYLHLYNTSSTITGTLSDLPSSMTYLILGNTSSTITGTLSDLPSSMEYLNLYNTSSTITGGATQIAADGIVYIRSDNCSEDQATVDSVLERIYTDRAIFTDATPELNIAGDNAAPSGTYQYAASPSTGLEYAYALENDDDGEGFNIWDITYTAP